LTGDTVLRSERLRIRDWHDLDVADPGQGRWAVERAEDGVVVGTVILLELPGGDGELEVSCGRTDQYYGCELALFRAAPGVPDATVATG
jgi:hypothetical protein